MADIVQRLRDTIQVAKEPARRVRRSSETVDRLATYVETEISIVRRQPVLVLSMGKAGTTSLEAALVAHGHPVLKAHALSAAGIRSRLHHERTIPTGPRPRFLWKTQVARADLELRRWQRWHVVSAVRDPMARAISAHFYATSFRRNDSLTNDLEWHALGVRSIIEEICFREDWFADELMPATGTDVYAEPFDWERGFQLYSDKRFRLLLIRQESLNDVASTALSELLHEPIDVPKASVNAAAQKQYREVYRRFLDEWRFDVDLLARVYSCRVARHFYSADERDALVLRWSLGPAAAPAPFRGPISTRP